MRTIGLALILLAGAAGCDDAASQSDDDAATEGGDLAFPPGTDLASTGTDGGAGGDGGGAGTDGGAQPDLGPPPMCPDAPFSTFAEAAIRFTGNRCRYTVAEAKAGIEIPYELI